MPAIIPAVAAYFGASAATSIGVSALVGAIAGSVIGAAIANRLTRQEKGDLFDQQSLGLELNREANDAPIPVVYGLRGHLGGVTCFKHVSGESNENLNKIVVYSEGTIKQVMVTYFDQKPYTDARFSGVHSLYNFVGTDDQAASQALIDSMLTAAGGAAGDIWTSAHQGKGVAYTYAKLTWSETAWLGEPLITADIYGRVVYDPRTGETKSTHNPALVIRDYLTNTRYGRGIPESAIDDATFIAAANYCEERVASPVKGLSATCSADVERISFATTEAIGWGDGIRFPGSAPGGLSAGVTYYAIPYGDKEYYLADSYANALSIGNQLDITSGGTFPVEHVDHPRYTCNGVVNTDETPFDNVAQLLLSCRGFLLFSGGKYKLKIDRDESPSGFVFNEDNIIGGWTIAGPSKRSRFNRVKARFFNTVERWQPDFAIQENATYRTQDNGLLLERQIDLPYTTHPYIAARIAQLEMRQSRFGLVISFRATVNATRCEVGDVVELTHATPAFTLKKFRVLELELLPDDEVNVTLGEYDDTVYALDTIEAVSGMSGTGLPSPFDNLTISGLTLASGTDHLFRGLDGTIHSRIKARWSAPASPFVDRYELQFLVQSGSPNFWQNASDVKGEREGYCVPVDDGKLYYVRVRAVTSLGNKGPWSPSDSGLAHTVVGKTASPSDVTGFAAQEQNSGTVVFIVDTITDPDLDLIEIRWADAGNTRWEDAQPLCNILRGRSTTTAALPPGDWTFLAKAKDTTGNYSVGTASTNLTVEGIGTTVISATEYAPKWLGHLDGLAKHWTGVLIPESTKLASQHTNAELFEQFVPYPVAHGYFAPHSPIDKGIDAVARIWGDIVSTLRADQTGSAAPEVQVDHRLSTTSFDGYEVWTIGSPSFRYVQARIHVDTSIGKPIISAFELTIDGIIRVERFTDQAIGASGTTLTYSTPYHNSPSVEITADSSSAQIATYTAKSTTSVVAHLYNRATGAGETGTADIVVTGV